MPTTRTITLTDQPPVKIADDAWLCIAYAEWSYFDGQYEFQSNRKWKAWVRVRQHSDGRTLVYGRYDYDTQFQGEPCESHRGGVLLAAGEDVVTAIRNVCSDLGVRSDQEKHWLEVAQDCIADLPAVEI